MHQTAVLLDFKGNTVALEIQLPLDRLAISFRQPVDAQSFPAQQAALKAYVLDHVHPTMSDGRPLTVRFEGMTIQTVEAAPYLVVHLLCTPLKGASIDQFMLNYDVITHEIVTHVVLVSIRSDDRAPNPPAEPVVIGLIRGEKKWARVDRARFQAGA